MLTDFRTFIVRGNVMDMAVGIIVGAAFTAIVSSLVADLINPIIGLFTGGVDFSDNYLVLSGTVAAGASVAAARESGASVLAYGSFLMAVINFLIIAWVVFMLVKGVNALKNAAERQQTAVPPEPGAPEPAAPEPMAPEPVAPAGPTQEDLLTEIRDLLKAR